MSECRELVDLLKHINVLGFDPADYVDLILTLAATCAEFGADAPGRGDLFFLLFIGIAIGAGIGIAVSVAVR